MNVKLKLRKNVARIYISDSRFSFARSRVRGGDKNTLVHA